MLPKKGGRWFSWLNLSTNFSFWMSFLVSNSDLQMTAHCSGGFSATFKYGRRRLNLRCLNWQCLKVRSCFRRWWSLDLPCWLLLAGWSYLNRCFRLSVVVALWRSWLGRACWFDVTVVRTNCQNSLMNQTDMSHKFCFWYQILDIHYWFPLLDDPIFIDKPWLKYRLEN